MLRYQTAVCHLEDVLFLLRLEFTVPLSNGSFCALFFYRALTGAIDLQKGYVLTIGMGHS